MHKVANTEEIVSKLVECKKQKEYEEAFELTKKIICWTKRCEEQESLFFRIGISLVVEYPDHKIRRKWENVRRALIRELRRD